MVYENILFHKSNMATFDGYFYLLDYPNGALIQKTANGKVAFQFPIDIPINFTYYTVGEVVCLQYDNYSIWSLQNFTAGNGVLIRQWIINNHICVLNNQYPKINVSNLTTYSVSTFSVESYKTQLTNNIMDGDTVINIDEYTESVIFPGTVIGIGYNKYAEREQVTVSGVVGQDIYLNAPLKRSYFTGDKVIITPSIMLFNNYNGVTSTLGSLILFDPNTGLDISVSGDVEYKGITSSKFIRLQNILQNHPDVHTLAYTKGTSLKLKDMSDMYRYRGDIRCSDTFDSPDFSHPDETKWNISNGDPQIYNNKLFCSTVGVGHDSVSSTYRLLGDFSIQVSGTVGDMTVFPGSGTNSTFYHYMGLTFSGYPLTYRYGLYYTTNYPDAFASALVYLKFDGNTLDYSSYSNNGVPYNNPTLTMGMTYEENTAYSFNGTSYIQIANTPELEVGKANMDFSVSFWLKLNGPVSTSWQSITHKGTVDTTRTFSIWRIPNTNNLHCRISTTYNYNEGIDTVTPLVIGEWTLVTYVKSVSTLTIYLNTFKNVSTTLQGSTVSNTGPIYIGDSPWSVGVVASIDNYRLFNLALSHQNVAEIYNNDIFYLVKPSLDCTMFSTYIGDIPIHYTTLTSGIAQFDYNIRAERIADKLYFSYQTLTSGTPNIPWETHEVSNVYTTECLFSLGLTSSLITVSGSYFDNLVCTKGYLRYPAPSLPYYGIMNMDNVQTNQSTLHTIYDIDIEGDNLYRLQKTATYYGSNYSWSTYNFQVSPIRSFIDFITVDSDTHILPATGRNTTPVRSITLDQYGQGVVNRPVTFKDNDAVGFITTEVVHTDIFYNTGKANTAYTSGTDLRVVEINAKVTQLD